MKKCASTLYLPLHRNPKTKELERDKDGFLFAKGIYRTKIRPEDLPDWYVKGYIHRQEGYLCAKGVRYLLYKPNYLTGHRNKDDFLFISYNDPIEPDAEDRRGIWFHGYDHVVWGDMINDFLQAAKRHSNYDISSIMEELEKKERWYQESQQ